MTNPGMQYIDLKGLKITKLGAKVDKDIARLFNSLKIFVLSNFTIERKSGQKEIKVAIPTCIDFTDSNSKLELTFAVPGGGSNSYEVVTILADPSNNTLSIKGNA